MAGILIFYEPLPEDLRRRLERDAEIQNVTPYDLARGVLSKRYKVAWKGTRLPYRPAGEKFKLRVSPELRMRIGLEAAEHGGTIRGVVLNTLARHYKLAPIDQARRPRSTA